MSTLTGNKISLTYKSIFKTSDNDVLTAALKQMSDGFGNNSGIYLNTGGDLKSTGILEFANFKGTSTAVSINKLVSEADGISNNDNDTSLPTSAAVKDYVDTNVTSQDLDFKGDSGTGAVDLDSQLLDIAGTTNEITTVALNQKLTIGLPNNVIISGTYTGATFLGDLNGTINTATTATTQSAGNNSTKVATTAYVDTLDAASDLDFSGTTGTGDVNLNTQSFAVTGTANQITTVASNQGLQISLLSTGVTMPNGSIATTQSAGDNSTKLATTAYVDVLDSASDLDITDGSNTSDVNLNTQSLSILGTTNEIVSTVSAQTATISLPSTINVNVVGNVTGALTGNADTATKWETARNLSVSGEATGTISNVDGSVAVSGAVTLTNSAVVGKVLTGLPTPAAGNIQAADTILEAFGKVQSQINSISSGLIFKGSWDAATNTPTLISGGGEVDSGTTDGATTAFKLIDSSQNFNTSVSIGNKVINQVDGTTALVTVIDSNTQLTLNTDIMLTAEAYTIDASPFIPQGNYYVVNFAGTTNLNGINVWSIGDWVIADADNRWSKLDHSQVDGQGTPNTLPKWETATTLIDSIVAESGTALTITGSATTTLGLSSTGNFAVNTNKFTANATTGNVAFTGDLSINSGKFSVSGTNGDTFISGTSRVNGISSIGGALVSGRALAIYNTNTNNEVEFIGAEYTNITSQTTSTMEVAVTGTGGDLKLATTGGSLTINDSGNSTFTGNLGIGTAPITSPNGADKSLSIFSGQDCGIILKDNVETWEIYQNDDLQFSFGTTPTTVLTLARTTGNATFAGDVTATSKKFIATSSSSGDYVRMYGASGTGRWDIYGNGENLRISENSSGGGVLAVDSGATFGGNVTFSNLTSASAASSSVDEIKVGTFGAGRPALYFGTSNTTYSNSTWFIENIGSAGKLRIGRNGLDVVEIFNDGTTTFAGNVGIGTGGFAQKPLDVSGATGGQLLITGANDAVGTTAGILLRAEGGESNGLARIKGGIFFERIAGSFGNGTLKFAVNGSVNNDAVTVADTAMTIDNSKKIIVEESILFVNDAPFRGAASIRQDSDILILTGGGNGFAFNDDTNAVSNLLINSGGEATFSSAVNIAGTLTLDQGSLLNGIINTPASLRINIDSNNNNTGEKFVVGHSQTNIDNNNILLEINESGAAEFTGNLGIGIGANGSYKLRIKTDASQENGAYISAGDSSANHSFYVETETGSAEYFAVRGDGQIRMGASGVGDVIIGSTAINGSYGASNTVLAVKGNSSGGEGVVQITGLAGNSGDNVGRLAFFSQAEADDMASIRAVRGSSDDVGSLEFNTNSGGGASSKRMLITSGGQVLIRRSVDYDSSSLYCLQVGDASVDNHTPIVCTVATTATRNQIVFSNNAGNNTGQISTGGSATSYNTSSDYRLKEDLQDFAGLDMVSKIPVYDFKWKTDESRSYGVMAHELQEVLPQAVNGKKDAKEMQSVDYSKIVPLLLKSIQELTAKVERLEQECKCK